MNVLIVVATNFEISSPYIQSKSLLITGVGMVNAAVNLTKELMQMKYDLVINMGIAGSFLDELKDGEVVEVIEDSFSEVGFEDGKYFDEFSDFDLKTQYQVEGKTCLKKVRAITVNTVHGRGQSIREIVERLKPDIESMEGASIFKVCEEFGVPCLQVRSISNRVEKRNRKKWNLDLSIRNLNIEVEKILNSL
tara:strand:- start:26043 stop:26621 length:579 start_codon:yes stop_codon:yes gene_type:complete